MSEALKLLGAKVHRENDVLVIDSALSIHANCRKVFRENNEPLTL